MKTKNNNIYFPMFALSMLVLFSLNNILVSQYTNYALRFDGINDYVEIPEVINDGEFSIELWFNLSSADGGYLYSATKSPIYFDLSANRTNIYWQFESADDTGSDIIVSGLNLIVGNWYHLVAIGKFNSSGPNRLFLDGLEIGWNNTTLNNKGSLNTGYIGKARDSYNFGALNLKFNGKIDEVRIWEKALTLHEIQSNMYNHLTGSEDGLVGYWPFNEGTGSLVNDFSGNNNHGTVNGATWVASGAPLSGYSLFANPNFGYLNNIYNISIVGINTHFSDSFGTSTVWISKNENTIYASSFQINSNTSLNAEFFIPTDVPTGFWNLNVETAIDSILTINNAIKIIKKGNYALQFDGVDDYVSLPDGISNLINSIKAFSLAGWFRWTGGAINNDILMITIGSDWGDWSLYLDPLDDGKPSLTVSGDYVNRVIANTSVLDGEWHFITGTLNTDTAKIFIDGIMENYNIQFLKDIGNKNSVISGNNNAWTGIIDEVQIWNKALTEQEIQANMYNQLTGLEDGLVGYWPFNEGAGSLVNDLSGNDNHGTIYGAKWVTSGAPLDGYFLYANPNFGYLNNIYNTTIVGINTHFSDSLGTSNVWLSRDDNTIFANTFQVISNTSLTAVFYIPLDAPTGFWSINVETAIDSILTINNAIEIVEKGYYALQFDGVDDYVDCGNDKSLNFGANESFTIEAWIVVDHVDDEDSHLFGTWGNSDIGFYILRVMSGTGKLSLEIEDINSRSCQISNGKTDLRDGSWHHVMGVRDKINNKLYQYVDGVLDGFTDDITTGSLDDNHRFSIGQRFDGYGHHYGIIDEVRIWNVAWTQAEVQANMFRKVSSSEPGLVGYWSFNEGAGNTAYDYSGNDNHGRIHGASWIPSSAPSGMSFFFANPNIAYLNHSLITSFRGTNTHFADSTGTTNVWLSKGETTIQAHSFTVQSNFFLDAVFVIPADVPAGFWDIHVETAIDSMITMNNGIEILSPPALVPQSCGTSHWLKGISAVDEYHAWAVGNQGTIVMTTDGGESWSLASSGTANTLNAVHFVNSNTGWIVGQSGIILNTTNGGSDWTSQNSGTVNNLQAVFFSDASRGWAVGANGTILHTGDGGVSWNPQSSGTSAWLYAVCFSDADRGRATGSSGTILRTIDGGTTWNPQSSGTSEYLFSTYFIDAVSGWAVGSGGTILKTTDEGSSWSIQNSGTSNWLRSVCFTSADTGFAVGNAGTFLMSSDGGNSWGARRSWTGNTLNSICFADHNSGWMVGEAGTIMKMSFQGVLTSIDDGTISTSPLPREFALMQNYPNPFNPSTTIRYKLPRRSKVSLKVYNLLGQEVRTLLNELKAAGEHQVLWDGRDQFNHAVSTGIYIYSIQAGLYLQSKKMVLLK